MDCSHTINIILLMFVKKSRWKLHVLWLVHFPVLAGRCKRMVRIESDAEERKTYDSSRVPRLPEETKRDARVVAMGVKLAAAHATCAAHLLEHLVLSDSPVVRAFHRIRMRIYPKPIESKSKELIRDGDFENDGAANDKDREDL